MSEITLKTAAGADAGRIELDDAMFAVRPNVALMHQVVTAQLAKRRAGTQSTKTRSEVRGGGAKPYRQKGTGNARQGSTNSPHFAGGGVAHGPKPRSYAQRTPKKMIKAALRSALSDRAADGKIVVVDGWGFDAPKTKDARTALAAIGVEGRALVVVDRFDGPVALSFRNLPEVQVIKIGELNAYDVLCNDWIVFERAHLPSTDAPTAPQPQGFAAVAEIDEIDDDVAVETDDDAPYGPGSHVAIEGDEQPAGFDIKGNADSMLYHLPGSAFYDRTIAEVWFDTAESAEAAGFSLPPSQVTDETETDETEGRDS